MKATLKAFFAMAALVLTVQAVQAQPDPEDSNMACHDNWICTRWFNCPPGGAPGVTDGMSDASSDPVPEYSKMDGDGPQLQGGTGMAGDPVDMALGHMQRQEVDFNISLKYGVPLTFSRFYNSMQITAQNENWETMLGPHWFSTYDMRLYTIGTSPNVYGYTMVDDMGRVYYMEHHVPNQPVYESEADETVPLRLTVSGSQGSEVYTVDAANGVSYVFNKDGRIKEIDYNRYTAANEKLFINYDTQGRVSTVTGPDDRYLQFNYLSDSDPLTPYNEKQVSSIYFVYDRPGESGSELAVSFEYGPKGLEEVRYSSNTLFRKYYEYGNMTIDSNDVVSWNANDNTLGRVSYTVDSGANRVYYAGYGYSNQTINNVFSYNVSVTPHQWERVLHRHYDGGWVFRGDDPNTDPTTYVNWTNQENIASINYANLSSPMPITTYGYSAPELGRPSELRRLDGSSSYPLIEHVYDRTNADVLYKWNLLEEIHYPEWDLQDPYFTPSPIVTTYSYDSTFPHLLHTKTAPTGETTTVNYHGAGSSTHDYGREDYVENADGTTTEFSYDQGTDNPGLLTKVTQRQGTSYQEASYEYSTDLRGNVKKLTNPDGSTVEYTYDNFNKPLTRTESHLGTTSYIYSNASYYHDNTPIPQNQKCFFPPLLLEVVDPQNHVTRYTYNPRGQIVQVRDANSKITINGYDARGRLTSIANAANDVVHYEYDVLDRLVKFIDGNSHWTAYDYDEFGRLIKTTEQEETGAAPIYTELTYSDESSGGACGSCGSGPASSAVSHIRMQDGNTVDLRYDLMGRLLHVDYAWTKTWAGATDYSTNPDVSFTYDDSSRVVSVFDARLGLAGDKSYHFEYDDGEPGEGLTGRLYKVTHPEGYTQEYFFQDNSAQNHYRRLSAYRDIDGNVSTYSYDSLGRVYSLTDPWGGSTVYTYAGTSDTSYPVGAIKNIAYSNGSNNTFTYTNEGRLDRVSYKNGSSSVFDYIDLAYDPVGVITHKERGDSSGATYTTSYGYDDAYRLNRESIYQGPSLKNQRTYGYDDAGNRTTLNQWDSVGIIKSTSFTYGNRNQLKTSNGYNEFGTVSTGAIAYAFDQKGNMTARNGQSYLWNEENRLVEALVSSGDPKSFQYSVFYRYDHAGRRILEHKGNSSSWWDQAYSGTAQRTRHFFNGLTEEVRKVSVGTHADDSFGFVTKGATTSAWAQTGGTGGSITSVSDASRRSDVIRFLDNDSCASYFRTSFSPSETRRALSFWIKPVQCYPFFQIRVNTSAGVRTIAVWAQPGTNSFDGASTYRVYLGYLPANQWTRIERDLGQIISTLTPGVTYTSTGWFEVAAREFYLDDLRFSNSITVEKNVLAGGSIGHIVRNRTVDQATCAATDKWFHYDQAGSVMAVSNASGALLTRIQQDAFGNVLADWMTGQWADNDASVGWHHNTKEFSGDTGLTYMYQRWYLPEIGTFSQKDRFPGAFDVPMSMHKYSFGFQSPTRFADPDGNVSAAFATAMSGCIIGAAIQLGYDIWKYYAGAALPATAAAWAASYICACGFGALAVTGFFGVGPIGVGVLARPLATATTAQGAGLIAGAISFGCLKGACNTIVAEILTGLPTPTPGQYWYDPVGVNVGGGYPIVFF